MSQTFTTSRILHFGDCDISGTASFPSYLNILNGVNEEFFGHLGFPWNEIIWKERWGTPTVHLACDFSKPSLFGDELVFTLNVVKLGRSSVTLAHSIDCGDEHRWNSTQVLAASDLVKHTSMPWPEAVREALAAYL